MSATMPDRLPSTPVETAEQFDAMSSAVRFELISFLIAAGPCSIAVLAEQMDRRADGLYHHIRKLIAAGLVKEVGFQKSGRQVEAIYDSVADHFAFDVDLESGRNVDRILQVMKATLRRSERIFKDAIDAGVVSFNDETRNSFIRGETAWLEEKEMKMVVGHLNEITKIFKKGRQKREGKLFALTFNMSPLVRSRSASSEAKPKKKQTANRSRKD